MGQIEVPREAMQEFIPVVIAEIDEELAHLSDC